MILDDFTKTERTRIDCLYGSDFAGDITQDDVKLIARFEYARAYEDIQAELNHEQIANDSKRDLENAQMLCDQALANMQEQQIRALARLDALEKRERPTIEQAQKEELKPQNMTRTVRDGK